MGNQLQVKSEGGMSLAPQNMEELYTLAHKISASSLAPKDYKGKADDTAIAMMMGLELGLNPMQAIQNIAVINGRPSIWGDALLALVQNHPSFKGIVETFDDKTMTATCVVTRKGGMPHTQTFSRSDAETAGLWGRNTWKQYPKRMLAMRARGFALRNQFADALLGLITAEEAYDLPDEVVINPSSSPSIEVKEPPVNECSEEKFNGVFPTWEKVILDGRDADKLITHLSTKGLTLTKAQEEKLKKVGK